MPKMKRISSAVNSSGGTSGAFPFPEWGGDEGFRKGDLPNLLIQLLFVAVEIISMRWSTEGRWGLEKRLSNYISVFLRNDLAPKLKTNCISYIV